VFFAKITPQRQKNLSSLVLFLDQLYLKEWRGILLSFNFGLKDNYGLKDD